MNHTIHLTVNGEPFTLDVASHHTLDRKSVV